MDTQGNMMQCELICTRSPHNHISLPYYKEYRLQANALLESQPHSVRAAQTQSDVGVNL